MRKGICAGIVLLAMACGAGAADSSCQPPRGFSPVFNGKDLSGWWGIATVDPRTYLSLPADALSKKKEESQSNIHQHWRVENGELVNDGKGLFLTTDQLYGDFELLVDYKTVALADSGIYLRGVPQVQIWDYTDKKKFNLGADKGSGGLWNNSPGAAGKDPFVLADKPFGEWNHFRIIMVGSRVWVWLNDKQTVRGATLENYFDRNIPVPAKGPIQLQTHGGEIRWRNLFVREIGSSEANDLLRNTDPPGFAKIFNGKNLDGWAGATDNYTVKDGAITCKPGKGGVLHTTQEYSDFIVRLEFKLPPGGNNGLAIRYPNEGDTAYAGMCELQVLDDNYEKVKNTKLDPRQMHGSVYGMVAAQRGYQHPVGEWNYQEVTVRGCTIKVELNGTVILNTDLKNVKEFLAGKAHPGKDRTRGTFGFAGHNDPVMFRNIAIRPLN